MRREYVPYLESEKIYTNGVEPWSMPKRAYRANLPPAAPKHPHRYVAESCGRHNIHDLDPIQQMEHVVAGNGRPAAHVPGPDRRHGRLGSAT